MASAKQPTSGVKGVVPKPAAGSPGAKAAADVAAAAISAGRRLQLAREGRDTRELGLAHAAVAEQRRLQLASKRPESRRVADATKEIADLEVELTSTREAEQRAADSGGDALLKAVELKQKRFDIAERIKAVKTQRMAMMLEDETRLRDAERQQHALEKLEIEYVQLKSSEQYAEAYQLSLALKDLRVRLAALWRELTTGQLSEALMGMGTGATDAEDVEAGMQPTIPAPFSFADHTAVLLAAINKSRRKIRTLRGAIAGNQRWFGGGEDELLVNPRVALEAEESKLLALETRLAERFATKSKKESSLRPSPCAFGVSASRFSADSTTEGTDSLSKKVFKEVMKGAAAAAEAAKNEASDDAPNKKKKVRRTKRARRVRRRRRPVPPNLLPSPADRAATAVRLGAGSLSPFGFASATPTYRGAASKGVPWGVKEIDRPSLIRNHSVGQPAPRKLRSQQYAALLLDAEFRPGERPRQLFPHESRPAMGVLFKEHAASAKAPKTSSAQRQSLKYTWNPVPTGVIGVDLSRWNDDGTRAEEDAPLHAEKTITKPLPCWAWPGGDGQRRDGAEQWVTEMDSVVDEMFEALAANSTDNATGSPRAKQPAASTADDGGGSDLTSARTIFDSSLLGRSRVAAGVVGLRRRLGSVKRGGGLPSLPFVAFTLLRQSSEAGGVDDGLNKSSADESGTSPTAGARTLLLPDPASSTKGKPKATPWTDQTHGDGWMEDTTTVLWHVAGFEEMTYSKHYALPSTKELGFSEMSFMRSPKTSAHEQRSLAAGTQAMSNMMMTSRYYRYSARGMCDMDTMLPHDLRHGPVGESELASAVANLRFGLRSAALSCCASDIPGLFFRKFQLGAHESMGFWELSHVVRKTAEITEDDVSESFLLEIFTLVRDTHDDPDDSSDEEEEIVPRLHTPEELEQVQKIQKIQARFRGNRVRGKLAAGEMKVLEEEELLVTALADHPGGAVRTGDATTITPHQLQVFLRTWMWRTLAFDLGWRLHEVGLLK